MTMAEPGRILGIDYGAVRVGLAVTDPLQILASGAGVLENAPGMLEKILEIVREQGIVRIVVGMPYAPDGGMGKTGEEIGRFASALSAAVTVPVETWDESGSSRKAIRALIEGGAGRKKRRERGRVDEMAARILLQEFLDHREGARGR
jgi:putative Holliday junction resolvase